LAKEKEKEKRKKKKKIKEMKSTYNTNISHQFYN